MANEKLKFTCDYMEGAHPLIMDALLSTNMMQTSGYGLDEFSASARDKIRKACEAPDAGVYFLVGGTQTNATVIDALLRSYQGVLCAETGHIAVHEAGAIEFGGHKVLPLPHTYGKISATQISSYMDTFLSDETHEHMVMPGMVYISQPTEYGTLYSLEELTALSEACRRYHLPLYVDGARLAYALAAPENTVSLKDLARLCDVFYIGGTKCGAFFGEAVVIPDPALIPHFFTIVKQHGALFAKGRILGIQFDVLFTDDLYLHIGESALNYADSIKNVLKENDPDRHKLGNHKGTHRCTDHTFKTDTCLAGGIFRHSNTRIFPTVHYDRGFPIFYIQELFRIPICDRFLQYYILRRYFP